MNIIPSPLTGTTDVRKIGTLSAERLASDWKSAFNINIAAELHGYKEIYLYQCNKTGLKYFVPYDVAGSARLYEQLQKFDWFYMDNKWEYDIALRHLLDCNNILEVGSGSGSFVKAGINAGHSMRGIELNENAINEAKRQKLPIDNVSLGEYSVSHAGAFDAVCSFQVLEHVSNPKEFIEWSINALKPAGKLIFCVPNAESFLRYQYNLLDMPPHHMTQWSKKVFKALEKIFPVKIEKIYYEPLADYHVDGYLNAYVGHFNATVRLSKLMLNRHTLPLIKKFLLSGARKYLRGQSIYVQYRKI